MAKVTFNQLIELLRGGIGGLVFRKRPDGTIIVSGAPRSNKRKTSQKQKDHRKGFGQKARYARSLAHQYPIYAEMARTEVARGKWKSAYNFALSDCYHPPEIHCVERREGCIRVEATDNILVARVSVTVLNEENKVIETGDAVRQEGDWWEFISYTEGKTIKAQAWDLARNVTEQIV